MHKTLFAITLISLLSSAVDSQETGLGQAYDSASEKFKVQEELLNKEFERLRRTLELGKDSAPAAFDEAKTTWLKFRKQYCFAISQAFGGMYAGPHDIECQTKMAAEFIKEMQQRTW